MRYAKTKKLTKPQLAILHKMQDKTKYLHKDIGIAASSLWKASNGQACSEQIIDKIIKVL